MSALILAVLLSASDAGAAKDAGSAKAAVERPLYYGKEALIKADHGFDEYGQKTRAGEPDPRLKGRSLRELTLMRNWIYARTGNSFRRKWLNEFFRAQPWYVASTLDDSKLSATDRANADAIASYEADLAVPELKVMRDAARARGDQLELRLISVRLGGWAGEGPAPADLSPLEDPSKLGKLLTLKQLDDFSPRDLKLLRNTIFARHNRPFQLEVNGGQVAGHFATVEWYHADDAYTDARLTEIDKKNVQLIRSLEKSLGVKELDHWYVAA